VHEYILLYLEQMTLKRWYTPTLPPNMFWSNNDHMCSKRYSKWSSTSESLIYYYINEIYTIIKNISVSEFETGRAHGFGFLKLLLFKRKLRMKLQRVAEELVKFGVVNQPWAFLEAQVRQNLRLNLIDLEFVSHQEEKSQRSHSSGWFRIILLKYVQISFRFA